MRRTLLTLAAAAVAAAPALAQERMGGMALPDHWLTWDSVTAGLALTDDQLVPFGSHYEQLNTVMKAAAAERAKLRDRMQGSMGGGPPSEEMRTQMAAMRATMDSLQADVDTHHKAIRNILTAAQQATFDQLPKPVVMMQRGGMRRP